MIFISSRIHDINIMVLGIVNSLEAPTSPITIFFVSYLYNKYLLILNTQTFINMKGKKFLTHIKKIFLIHEIYN